MNYNYIKLYYFNLFLRLFYCIISGYYSLGWPASKVKGRYMWMGLIPSQVSEILLGVCSSAEYNVINFARCHQSFQRPLLLIVYKFFLSCVAFSYILYIRNILTLRFITILLFFYSILISFQIYTFYPFSYFIESLKVWKKPKYNILINKCVGLL